MPRTRRGRRGGRVIDIGLDYVEVTLSRDGQSKALIRLRDGRTLFHDVNDICCYENGVQTSCPERGPGNLATRLLGELFSRQPGVVKLQFRNHNGVWIMVDLTDPDLTNNLRNLAQLMLNRAEALAKTCSNP